MLFSIITVVRNNLQGLQATHDSVAGQSCTDYQWIVIDGASSDGTVEYMQAIAGANNLIFVSERDKSLFEAMNKGLMRAKGDYVMFLNGGDGFASPETLSMVKLAIASQTLPPSFIYGDALEEWPGHPPVLKRARNFQTFFQGMITHHQAMLYRRDDIKGLRFDASYAIAGDFKFTAQFLQEADETLYVDFPLCLFEAGGLSQRRFVRGRNEQFRARRELALCGGVKNLTIYAQQTALMSLRKLAPTLYWKLRLSAGNNGGGKAPDAGRHGHRENHA